jgi:hypothetical protein
MALARRLEVSVGCLRSWRRDAPRYARLALCALIAGVDPDLVGSLANETQSQACRRVFTREIW